MCEFNNPNFVSDCLYRLSQVFSLYLARFDLYSNYVSSIDFSVRLPNSLCFPNYLRSNIFVTLFLLKVHQQIWILYYIKLGLVRVVPIAKKRHLFHASKYILILLFIYAISEWFLRFLYFVSKHGSNRLTCIFQNPLSSLFFVVIYIYNFLFILKVTNLDFFLVLLFIFTFVLFKLQKMFSACKSLLTQVLCSRHQKHKMVHLCNSNQVLCLYSSLTLTLQQFCICLWVFK